MSLLIKNARVVSPADGINDVLDILVQDGKIAQIGKNLPPQDDEIDGRGIKRRQRGLYGS